MYVSRGVFVPWWRSDDSSRELLPIFHLVRQGLLCCMFQVIRPWITVLRSYVIPAPSLIHLIFNSQILSVFFGLGPLLPADVTWAIFLIFISFFVLCIYVCVCVYKKVCHALYPEGRGQLAGLVLSFRQVGCQIWWQVPLPAEPSCWFHGQCCKMAHKS